MREFKAFEGRELVIGGARRDGSITETGSERIAYTNRATVDRSH